MKFKRTGLAAVVAIAVMLGWSAPALAATWGAGEYHYGGAAKTGTRNGCSYIYDAVIYGASNPNKSYGTTYALSGCDNGRVRPYYVDAPWSGWTSWKYSTNLSTSDKKSYGSYTRHEIKS